MIMTPLKVTVLDRRLYPWFVVPGFGKVKARVK